MANATETLQARADNLESAGADPLRVELIRRSRRFKRTWVEMAEALIEVKMKRSYREWAYSDFYAYCAEELLLKRRTVEKLTGSYQTLERHAPDVLAEAGDAPSFDAVDYYSRALERAGYRESPTGAAEVGANDPPEALQELHQAVFAENRPVASLRREFNALLFQKSPEEARAEKREKALTNAQRLLRLLPQLDDLPPALVAETAAALDRLCRELEPAPDEQESLQQVS